MKHFLKYLLFPPACAGCGERFDLFAEEEIPVFCLKCRVAWEAAVSKPCPDCGKRLFHCTCAPDQLRHAGCTELHKLCRYEVTRSGGRIGTRLVLSVKDRKNPRVFAFLGEQIGRALRSAVSSAPSEVLITYIPRSRTGKSGAGFDQGKELANALSRACGYPSACLFVRRGGMTQKKLSAKERVKNIRRAIRLRRGYAKAIPADGSDKPSLRGKTVILVDDIVTTGATMAVATELLLAAGAERVVGACVAVTFREDISETDS